MEFEDLQKVWDTQNDRPVFAMDDCRLAVGLYQQREHSRRRLFRKEFAPLYFTVPILIVVSAFLFLAFLAKTTYQLRTTDPPMTVWDGLVLVIALGAAIAVMVSTHRERRKHERSQNVFAPTLREELERGISQLDFELSLVGTARVVRLLALIAIGVSVILWETGRLNGDPTPWKMLGNNLLLMLFASWLGFTTKKKLVERVTQRRRALESMLAALDEQEVSR